MKQLSKERKQAPKNKDVAFLHNLIAFRRKKGSTYANYDGTAKGSGNARPFFELYKETYELVSDINQQGDTREIGRFLKLMPDEKKSVLDIGCAEGKLSVALAKLGHEVTAIDISEKYLERTGKLMGEMGVLVETIQCDIENNAGSIKGRKFDAIYFMDVIEHLKNPTKALSNIREALKDDGTLFLATPNANSLVRILMHTLNGKRVPDNREPGMLRNLHLQIYDFFILNQVLNFTGFRVEKLVPTRIYLPFLSQKPGKQKGGALGEFLGKAMPGLSHELLVVCKKAEPLDVGKIIKGWQ